MRLEQPCLDSRLLDLRNASQCGPTCRQILCHWWSFWYSKQMETFSQPNHAQKDRSKKHLECSSGDTLPPMGSATCHPVLHMWSPLDQCLGPTHDSKAVHELLRHVLLDATQHHLPRIALIFDGHLRDRGQKSVAFESVRETASAGETAPVPPGGERSGLVGRSGRAAGFDPTPRMNRIDITRLGSTCQFRGCHDPRAMCLPCPGPSRTLQRRRASLQERRRKAPF